MSILAWIVLSLISGFIDSKLVNKTGEGLTYGLVNRAYCRSGKPNSFFACTEIEVRTK